MKHITVNMQKFGTFMTARVVWPVAAVAVLTVLFYALMLDFSPQPDALAQGSNKSITGYAWSDTIGWVSFNGSTYGLSVDAHGTLSGYAWSDTIGWVSANLTDLVGCPSGSCAARIDQSGALTGWLRALSGGTSQSGGWDGFISLSGSNYGPARQSDGTFSGYAWGSDVVGWLDFRYASTDFAVEPTADLKVRKVGETEWHDSLTIEPTDEIELGWNQDGTANTTSCDAVPPSYGFDTTGAVSGTDADVEEPIGNTSRTYLLLCTGDGDSQKIDGVTVTTNGGIGAHFCAENRPGLVHRDTDVSLCWELGTNNPALCSIKAGSTDVLSPLPAESGTVTHRMLGEVTFTLQCTGGDGDTMTVKVLPEVQET